jgi:3-phytase
MSLLYSVASMAADTTVSAVAETRQHFNDQTNRYSDADDPAIWVHPNKPSHSFVAGALKRGGMDVYDLSGRLLQHIAVAPAPACANDASNCENLSGRLNNADLIYGFQLGNKVVDLVVISDRGLDKLAIFQVNPDAVKTNKPPLSDITAPNQSWIFSQNQQQVNEGNTAYGLGTAKTDQALAFVSQNSTNKVAVLELYDAGNNKVGYREKNMLEFPTAFTLPSGESWKPCSDDDTELPQFEGIVADEYHNTVYLSQEPVGVWKIDLKNPADKSQWKLAHKSREYGIPYKRTWDEAEQEYSCSLNYSEDQGFGNPNLYADIEGLSLYKGSKGKGYLLLSSQGNDKIAVFNREGNNKYLGAFHVGEGDIDEVNHTDSMMVVNTDLGGQYSQGLLVIHDGDDRPGVYDANGEYREITNYKYVPWSSIAKPMNLMIDTEQSVRQK